MMSERPKFDSHDDYIASMPDEVQRILLRVQNVVETALPQAQRCISYGMPAYRHGKIFFYFAGFKKHLGIYPPIKADHSLIQALAPFRNEKGNLAFSYQAGIPYDLIQRVALALAKEYA
ncbi:iron chaperone [Undibacterium fentianense]|uniref:DUF1801 domain-containing protein n=1 Tax=Undibacterium fentianense TaxID=2828728 RepID=A0A941E4I0_9BURK|nr:DUF1801 domain-containing protein [Undibacterium fentianense]MBR7800459.1 DUF1801 domain-containing protein [Undibacterium fentianense]